MTAPRMKDQSGEAQTEPRASCGVETGTKGFLGRWRHCRILPEAVKEGETNALASNPLRPPFSWNCLSLPSHNWRHVWLVNVAEGWAPPPTSNSIRPRTVVNRMCTFLQTFQKPGIAEWTYSVELFNSKANLFKVSTSLMFVFKDLTTWAYKFFWIKKTGQGYIYLYI